MKKIEILNKLKSGICEITSTDEFSVEFTMIGTLSQTHLPYDVDTMDVDDDPNTFVVFNVNTENWETLSVHSVIDVEQLTGEGAECNERKLQASSEYLQELFTDSFDKEEEEEDLDTMKHPDDELCGFTQ